MHTTSSSNNTGVPEQLWPILWHQDGIDAAQLGVDLQAEVGQHLGRGPCHVLRLDALGRYA